MGDFSRIYQPQAGYEGIVRVVAAIDDPGAPDHGAVIVAHKSNVITMDSRGIMARALAGDVKINAMAWGTGIVSPAKTDTKLGNEILVTAAGVINTAGGMLLRGAGVPAGVGVNGDYYVDITPTPHMLYGPKTATGWGSGVPIPAGSGTVDGETPTITPADYPTDDSVVFTGTLPPGVGTGTIFSEVGLKASNGKLYARFTFPGQAKFSRLRLSATWQIIFVR